MSVGLCRPECQPKRGAPAEKTDPKTAREMKTDSREQQKCRHQVIHNGSFEKRLRSHVMFSG
jgi:hypothetical protein